MNSFFALSALCAQVFLGTNAQQPLEVAGTKLTSYSTKVGTLAFSFPPSGSKNEFTGHIAGKGLGYTGISIGGGMLNRLLLVAWPNGDKVQTSFRFAGGYTRPAFYNGTAEIKELAHKVDGQDWSITFKCVGCLSWSFAGQSGKLDLSQPNFRVGYAASLVAPSTPSNAKSAIQFHAGGEGILNLDTKDAVSASYA